ncbi:acetolactate synthase large subunit [Patulibacter brassicae]|jgi:acetolactate synthase-1/2/3 large subunit|uniref:Acetolactate synthase large subunit n=1 Tax=Patulibacter brassicae TaxID=1705717 RepID=A0ABU4VHA2_9ACTN|nr:acetolactate synthase large subunit [Patulibacter brassicae]MDX8151194.1 acetolactate synthase large subunit [Patulibacter brassicae]
MTRTAAHLLVDCLEQEGVEVVFGIPGEENIHFVDALRDSPIRYVLVRHEQAASFMAEIWGRLTQRAAVCSATLGPGAINLQLGVADATTNSTPLIALSAQVGRDRSYKESHQGIDLVPMFAPITKWSALVPTPESVPEIVRKAFKTAQTERPGAVYLAVPEDIEGAEIAEDLRPLRIDRVRPNEPTDAQVERALDVLLAAERPIVLAGHGAAREGAQAQLIAFVERAGIPVASTFHGKGVFPDDHPLGLGAVGFMRHDYVNFGFDAADAIVAVGYELQEFDPVKINPDGDAEIVHVHRFPAEVDAHYPVAVGLHGSIARSLELLTAGLARRQEAGEASAPNGAPPVLDAGSCDASRMLADELERGAADDRFPVAPQRVVADVRAALDREDVVLADTGAVKMWMARLYPTYAANTCLLSNGLSTMGFALPGALAAKLVLPERRVLAACGDGAFLMHAQELETAVREKIPLCVLVWEDDGYGLIEWKMEMELGRSSSVRFGNPDVVAFAESFGGRGVRIGAADELRPALDEGLSSDGVTVIACPVDYRENLRLTDRLGELTEAL